MKLPDFRDPDLTMNLGFLAVMLGVGVLLLVAGALAFITRAPWQPTIITLLVYIVISGAVTVLRLFSRDRDRR